MQIYASLNEQDIKDMLATQTSALLNKVQAPPYDRTVIDGELVPIDSNGNDLLNAQKIKAWQSIRYDETVGYYTKTGAEFGYTKETQDVLDSIAEAHPSISKVLEFTPTPIEEE